jgi:hypothetical protein
MTKINQDFTVWSGDHKNVRFTVTDSDSASVDITNASILWTVSENKRSGSIMQLSTDSGCGVTVSGCTYTVGLSPTHTAKLAGMYYHESQARDTASDTSTLAVGKMTVEVDITE